MKSSALKLFLLLFGLIVSASATAYDFQSGGLYYRITSSTDKTVAVTYKTRDQDSGYSGAITIPSNVTYSGTSYSVTSIDEYAFRFNKSLTSITIPASIETIEKDAFYHCTSLSTVRLLDGGPIKLIAYYNDWDGYDFYFSMFYSCPITYFYFGRTNVSSSWIYADGGNDYYSSSYALREAFSHVETLVIGANVTEEAIRDFPKVNNSANITISGNHPTLKLKGNVIYTQDEKTLVRYWGQNDLFVPQTVTTIADGAFRDCESAIIELPSSITSIGPSTFRDCRNLSYIALPAATSIGSSAFFGCTGLTSVNMPAVTSIGSSAFYDCTGLTSLDMPAVTSIDYDAFSGCTGLTSLDMPAATSIGNYAFQGCTSLISLDMPAVTSIGEYTFSGCTGLTSLDMPKLTSIGRQAFSSYYNYNDDYIPACTTLSSVKMPAVTSIGSSAFFGCTGLTSLDMPAATSIGNYAFQDCTSLISLELPASVTSIGFGAFYGCNIKSVRVNREDLSTNSILHSYLPSTANWEYYINGKLVTTHFEVPEGTEKIGNGLFYNARDLTSVELPSSLTSISSSAFQSCTGLTSIELPSSLTSIESSAFQDCTGLTTVEMPAVTTIGTSAFQGCTHLTSMEMPVVTTIGSSAFQSCTGLTSMEMPAATNVGSSAFQGCTHLTSVEMPAVTTIGSSAFQNTSLKQIDIPASITSIGSNAFAGTAPTAFICRATTPPSLGTGNNFGGKRKLYVPYESVGEYKKKWALGSNYDYLPLLDVMFFEKTDKAAYQAALSGKTKNGITSVAFYDGGIGDDLTESILKRGMNPNCLYFLPDEAGLKGDNIISLNDYTADYVALTDAYAYECLIPFHASVIEYQHNPSVWATGHSGWETLCLPFAASEYEGSESGKLFPIILGSSGNFWLRRYVGSSANNVYFSSTYDGQMEANTPYLVAFPSSTMGDGHLEGQTITFRGYSVDLPVTKAPELHKNEFIFTGNYDKMPDGVTGWALNAEGSSFVQSSTVGNDPFRGYFKHKDATTGSNQLKISFGTFDETTGIFTPELNAEDSAASQNIYDLQGRRTTDSQQGVSIKNGKKHLSL